MRISKLELGTLVKREKRFLSEVELADRRVIAHCPNPGRMQGLATPGSEVYISAQDKPQRKLAWTWELVRCAESLVLVNTALPNALVEEALRTRGAELFPELGSWTELRREVVFGDEKSRADFVLDGPEASITLEVKSVTLAERRVGYFPDAVTERGRKHLRELSRLARRGQRAALLLLAGRGDVDRIRSAPRIDPAYSLALRAAQRAGVRLLGAGLRIELQGGGAELSIERRLPVQAFSKDLGPQPEARRSA